MSKVEDRVALWLSSHPGSTLVEVARGVHAKDETVRDVLGGPLFTFSLSGKSYRYWLRGSRETGRDEVRRAETDCDFLLRVLSDGQEHSLNEILRRSFADRGCGLTVHSRAADLRARGYRVDNWKDGQRGDGSKYRMLLGEDDVQVGEAAADPGSFPVRRSTVPTMPASSSPSEPLTEPGSFLPAVEVAPPLAGTAAASEPGASYAADEGSTRPGSVSGPRTSETDPVAREAAAGAAQPDGQMTLVGGAFTKRQQAA